jgi:DNA-binding NtrC family response regulator
MNVLVVDDQRSARRVLSDLLSTEPGTALTEAATVEEARRAIENFTFDLAFVDLRLSEDPRDQGGLQVLKALKASSAALAVMVSGHGEMADIRAAMREGAWDYVLKEDVCEDVIRPMIEQVRQRRALEDEVVTLRASRLEAVPNLVGTSAAMERLREMIRRVAVSDRPVLVQGPNGSGKELVVDAIHRLGRWPAAPLLALNCGAIPEQLIEAELFGHEKGAFTGADRKNSGLFASVGKGTLFLDEVAELPGAQQAKLLRVLETRRFRPVGATEEHAFEGRVVAATHADLAARVAEGRFREDLYHRLSVLPLRVPSLDERREDIPALVTRFMHDQPRRFTFTADAVELLKSTRWPGNVRQLRNVVDRLAVFVDEAAISADVLRPHLAAAPSDVPSSALRSLAAAALEQLPAADKLAAIEALLIDEAMARSQGNKTAAARLLGVHRKVIERRTSGAADEEPR